MLVSHDKNFKTVRRTLSRVCRCVALDFTAVSIFTHVYRYPFYWLRWFRLRGLARLPIQSTWIE